MLIVIALGFGKSFYLRPLFNDRPLPMYLVVHGVVMSAWYLLFLAQASLVHMGRTDLHRKLGIAGVLLAAAVVGAGLYVDLNIIPHKASLGVDMSDPATLSAYARFSLASMSTVAIFALIVVMAVALRRRSAVHKRLMYWAFVWSLGPAFTNTRPLGQVLDSLVVPYLPFFPADFIWLGLLCAYDWKTERRIHPATYLGFLFLAILFVTGELFIARLEPLQDWIIAYAQARG